MHAFRLSIVVGLFLAGSAAAQPLADRVPADAKFYVGWVGSTQLGDAYQPSHLKAVLDESGVRQLLDETVVDLIGQIPDREGRDAMRSVYTALGVALKYPTALYVTGIHGDPGPNQSPFDVAIICRAGDDAMSIGQHLLPLIAEMKAQRIPIELTSEGELVILALGEPTPPIKADQRDGSLGAVPAFEQRLRRIGVEAPVVVTYFDLTATWAMIDRTVAAHARPDEIEGWRNAREGLALDGVHALVAASGFAGPDWVTATHIVAPAPRSGIAAMLDAAEPIDPATYRLIPETAAIAGVDSVDLAGLFDAAIELIGKFDDRADRQIDDARRQIREQLGFDVRDDLLAALGSEWVYYTDRRVGGSGLFGLVLVNPLRDADKAEQSLTQLLMVGGALLAQFTQEQDLRITIRPTQADGVRMFHVTSPLISPTVAFHDGKLYLGLLPHTVRGAIARHQAGGKSILDNADFIALRRQLAEGDPASFSFVDVRQNLAATYPFLAMGDRLLAGAAESAGLRAPMMILPSLDVLQAHASPAGTFQWADEHGLHVRARAPFPGAGLMGAGQDTNLSVAGSAVAAGILVPALGRAREIANRSVSAANLSGLYKAIYTYSVLNDDRFPTDLAVLVEDGSIDTTSLFHPASGKEVPRDVKAQGLTAMGRWAAENSDYVYVAGWTANVPADQIVMYEKPHQPWTREGMNILFGDGHVEWQTIEQAKRTFKKLGMEDALKAKPAKGDAGAGQAFYYDTKTKEIFTADANQYPPIKSPDGNEAVRVHFFSCGDCTKEQRFIGFYEKYTDEAKKKLENADDAELMMEVFETGVRYSVDGETWHDPASEQFQLTLQAKLGCPGDGRARYCRAR